MLWLIVITAFGTDIMAYFSGYLLGKHKLCPHISPKKTIEGSVGGVLGSVILSGLFGWFFLPDLLIHCLVIGVLGGIVSQFGDLTASIFKSKDGNQGLWPSDPGSWRNPGQIRQCIIYRHRWYIIISVLVIGYMQQMYENRKVEIGMMKKISILGSTGSIGTQALDVITHTINDKFKVTALSCAKSLSLCFARQIEEFSDLEAVAVKDETDAKAALLISISDLEVFHGVPEGLKDYCVHGKLRYGA